jgi:8-oxo-dGTP pyrophosphatase MutT (NUDIX family)
MEDSNMNVKRGVSAIIYDKRGSAYYFLILHRVKDWEGWEFVKGKVDDDESSDVAIKRVVKEEAGLKTFNIFGKLSQKREFTNEDIL